MSKVYRVYDAKDAGAVMNAYIRFTIGDYVRMTPKFGVGDTVIYNGSLEELRGLCGVVTDYTDVLGSSLDVEHRFSVRLNVGISLKEVRGESLLPSIQE
jgi:hypothetical protein